VPQIVAAGNSNRNACNYSPASAAAAVTVGATDSTDTRASYSNYGTCLDIFGPGSSIKAAWINNPEATNTISGTSMATPHVAGVAAKYLSLDPSLSSAELTAQLQSFATKDVVKSASGGDLTNPANISPNLLVFGNCTQP
jgi:serine protease